MSTQLKDKTSIDSILAEMTLEEKLLLLTGESMFFTKKFKKYGIPKSCWLDGGTGFNTMQMTIEAAIQAEMKVKGDSYDPNGADNTMGAGIPEGFLTLNAMTEAEKMTPEEQKFTQAFMESSSQLLPDQNTVGCFPPGMLLGATWDPEAVYACGEALGREFSAYGVDVMLGSPNVNLHRDPRNGRLFEGYSEDPCLTSKLAPNYVKGVQDTGVIASVKHFAANNQETDRMSVNEIIPIRALYELYLPGFRACVQEGGCKTVMSAYNSINGIPCSHNPWLLKEVLRDDWGFEGVTVCDWGGVYDRVEGMKNGTNLTMPGPRAIGMLTEAVKKGVLSIETIDQSARRFLELLLEMPVMKGKKYTAVDTAYSFAAAYKAACEGITLLKNDGILPLSKDSGVTFFGSRSKHLVASGAGSAEVATTLVTQLYDEAEKKLGYGKVWYEEITPDTDVVFVTVGSNGQEGSDRPDMKMEIEDAVILKQAIEAAKKATKPVVLLLNTSTPVEIADIIDDVAAILCLYLPGMAGGKAGVDVLFGDAEPAGRLPLSWPRHYIDTPTAINFPGENQKVIYGEGLYVGYRYYDEKKIEPLFPFGYGLSYTQFSFSDLLVPESFVYDQQPAVSISVKVRNDGNRTGSQVVQLYLHDEKSTLIKPYKALKAFQKVYLEPGEEKKVMLTLTKEDFAAYDDGRKEWTVEPGMFKILIGTSAKDIILEAPLRVRGYNPYGVSMDTAIGEIIANQVTMKILERYIPGLDMQETFGPLLVLMKSTPFKEVWPALSSYFATEAERERALENIDKAFQEECCK